MMAFWLILAGLFLGFRILSTVVALVNWMSDTRLRKSTGSVPDGLISVLIPARNEEHNLPALLERLVKEGPVIREILVLDDHSTDSTAVIVKQYQEKDQRVRLLTGKPLPAGWLGKNFACHQLAEQATGTLFLFVDADVRPEPGAVEATVHRLTAKQSDFLSLFPYQMTASFSEWSVVAIMKHILLSLLPLPLVRLTRQSSLAAANGQWMAFRSEVYNKYRFHEQVRASIAEDIDISRMVKKLGFSAECLVSDGLIQCRMYGNAGDALTGFTKNIRQMLGGTTVSALILTVFMTFSFPVLLFSPWPWLVMVDWALLIITRFSINTTSGRPTGMEIIEIPLLMVIQWILVLKSIFTSDRNLTWKNRSLVTGS